jgi:hypothetical protein
MSRNETQIRPLLETQDGQALSDQQLTSKGACGRTLAMDAARMMAQRFRTVSITALMIGCFGAAGAAEREPSIPLLIREAGSFERIIVTTDKPVQLADLVGAADLVVEGSSVAQRSYLDSSEAHIYTDYSFTLTDIMKNRRRPGLLKAGRSIVVRRESGTVLINGLRATAIENGFPPFAENGRYLLFLKELDEPNTYAVIAGGRGAFEAGDQIAPMLSVAETPRQAQSRQAFFGEVKALLKFTE